MPVRLSKKNQIQNALSSLVGKHVIRIGKNSGLSMEIIHFGNKSDRHNEELSDKLPEYFFHIQCGWRISKQGQIIMGLADAFSDAKNEPQYVQIPATEETLLDWRHRLFQQKNFELVVKSVRLDNLYGIQIRFNGGCILDVFPMGSTVEEGEEHWRFVSCHLKKRKHLVVANSGVRFSTYTIDRGRKKVIK